MKEDKRKNANAKEGRTCHRQINSEPRREIDEARENGLDISVGNWKNWEGDDIALSIEKLKKYIYRWKKWHESA